MELSKNKKKAGVFCCAYACSNKPAPKKGGLCHKHYARKLRERDPVSARFNQFKGNATRRGKEFGISLEEFRQFCEETGYLKNGYRGYSATIDRVDNRRGYFIDNIQLLSNRANASKGASENECPF
jgi:hypothetical protein